MQKQNKKGFTLAELLIVVAIIAVLIAIAIPIFTSSLEKAKAAVDDANMRSCQAIAHALQITGEIEVSGVTYKLSDFTSGKAAYFCKDGSIVMSDWGKAPDNAYRAQTTNEKAFRLKDAALMFYNDDPVVTSVTCTWDSLA